MKWKQKTGRNGWGDMETKDLESKDFGTGGFIHRSAAKMDGGLRDRGTRDYETWR